MGDAPLLPTCPSLVCVKVGSGYGVMITKFYEVMIAEYEQKPRTVLFCKSVHRRCESLGGLSPVLCKSWVW